MQIVAGVDLGGTAVNYTLVNGEVFIEGLCEHPALSSRGRMCTATDQDGPVAVAKAGVLLSDTVAVGLDLRVLPAAPAC